MLDVLYFSFLCAICSGQSFREPNNEYKDRQSLRLDAEVPKDPEYNGEAPYKTEQATEPAWVKTLRQNIKSVVLNKGLKYAKTDIMDMIKNTNKVVNRQKFDFSDFSKVIPEGSQISRIDAAAPTEPPVYEPVWEQRLKKFIKDLIKVKGKKALDQYVNPTIKRIELNNNVQIKDIDVNPYGEVSVLWTQNKRPPPIQQQGPRGNN